MRLSLFYFLRHRPTLVSLVVIAVVFIVCWMVFWPRGLSRERQWPAQPGNVGPLLFSPDGKTLLSGGAGALRLWDPATGTLKSTLAITASPIAISPAEDLLAGIAVRRIDKHTDE